MSSQRRQPPPAKAVTATPARTQLYSNSRDILKKKEKEEYEHVVKKPKLKVGYEGKT